eukprot:TRINITY_DN24072_c0_g1_i1.p1 TRINITY_DN24072_c0_g1~~TRINITY_DN24072_c0_g1_i1.p1  ORF type:complete len:167 (+),score=24.02 TRINITY_DN24072_c0_g1_i1:409-909(+)
MGDDDPNFKNLPQELICPLHIGVLRNPVITYCGHSFCKSCIDQAIDSRPMCPLDRKELHKHQLYPNLLAKSLIDEQEIFCKYGSSDADSQPPPSSTYESDAPLLDPVGCRARVTFGRRHAHFAECPFAPVLCSLGCGATVPRSEQCPHDGTSLRRFCSQTRNSHVF